MNRILALYDYLLSPEGRKLVLFGFAGKDYKMVDDTVVSLHPASWNIGAAYPSTGVFNSLAAWGLAPDWQSEFKMANPIPATWTPALWSMFQLWPGAASVPSRRAGAGASTRAIGPRRQ